MDEETTNWITIMKKLNLVRSHVQENSHVQEKTK